MRTLIIDTALGTDAPNVVGLVYIAALGLDEGQANCKHMANLCEGVDQMRDVRRLSQQCTRAWGATRGPSLVMPAGRALAGEAVDVGAATQRQDVVNVLPFGPTLDPLISWPAMRIASSEEDVAPCTNT